MGNLRQLASREQSIISNTWEIDQSDAHTKHQDTRWRKGNLIIRPSLVIDQEASIQVNKYVIYTTTTLGKQTNMYKE